MISEYGKFDHLFYNLKPDTIEGIHIFGRGDKYIKPQKYDEVTNLENKIWADLYINLELLLDQYASREYLLGVKALPIPRDRFPEFDAISPILENSTGWTLLPVAGFLNEELFLKLMRTANFRSLILSESRRALMINMLIVIYGTIEVIHLNQIFFMMYKHMYHF